eukprot:14458908-Heterocapsa_arctica.AAC.1
MLIGGPMPPVALPRRDQSRGRTATAEDRLAELITEQSRKKGPTIFVPGMSTATLPTVKLMGGIDSYPNPALVMGPSGAVNSKSPTPFTQ